MPKQNLDQNTSPRPPVITVMGHIDHGKSTLLDYIRKTNITEKEAGGITQHISAYEITHEEKGGRRSKITFLDTPGHEAFAGIRTCSAGVADIAVLVVSAEDGVKPQTKEAYEHIKKCKLPFLVAITKIDKPSANPDLTKQSLAESGIYVEGYGGNVPFVPLSSKTGVGIGEFLDTIILMAELEELKGEEDVLGEGVIIESRLDQKKGIIATAIIKNGTVRKGTFASVRGATAPLRLILDAESKMVEELTFSSPIQIVGWDKLPKAGTVFKTFLKKDEALAYAQEGESADAGNRVSNLCQEGVTILPLIVKADVTGSLEAVLGEIAKLSRERIVPRVVLSGVGTISEGDIKTALSAEKVVVLGFNAKIDPQAAALAERSGIEIKLFDIIYELKEYVEKLLEEREPKIEVEEVKSVAKVLKIFSVNKNKQIIGARVLSGIFEDGANIRIIRREVSIGLGKVKGLQQAKTPVSSVSEESEFGALVESKMEIAPGDTLETFALVTK